MWFVVVLSLLVAVASVVLSVLALRRTREEAPPAPMIGLPEDVMGLRQEVAALRQSSTGALRHLSVVRYDAFGDVGGHLSWSLALVDDAGDGIVMTSIHGRTEARTYAKSISGWTSEAALSSEEEEAVAHARP